MKKTIHLLLAISLLASCSKKDDNAPGTKNGSKITQVNETFQNDSYIGNTFIHYDGQGRNAAWTYTDLYFTRQDTLVGPGGRILKYQYILNNGLVSEAHTSNTQENYVRHFSYDGQKRIIKVTIEEQYLNPNTGAPTSNLSLRETYDISWDDQSNVTSIKDTYSDAFLAGTNTGGVKYWIYNYSGHSSKYPNTLQLANIGLDFFGPNGYPANLIEGGSNGGVLFGPYFAGKSLPGHVSWQGCNAINSPVGSPQSADYTYTTDSKNRITIFNDGEGGTSRFSYQ